MKVGVFTTNIDTWIYIHIHTNQHIQTYTHVLYAYTTPTHRTPHTDPQTQPHTHIKNIIIYKYIYIYLKKTANQISTELCPTMPHKALRHFALVMHER